MPILIDPIAGYSLLPVSRHPQFIINGFLAAIDILDSTRRHGDRSKLTLDQRKVGCRASFAASLRLENDMWTFANQCEGWGTNGVQIAVYGGHNAN